MNKQKMANHQSQSSALSTVFNPLRWPLIRSYPKMALIVVAVLIIGGGYWIIKHKKTASQSVVVRRDSITETVSLTGNTQAVQSVSLAFNSTGIIAQTYVAVGDKVQAGQMLAQLNTADLIAQLHQAEADADSQKAKLAGIEAGARPEDIAASAAALEKAKQDLNNLYSSIGDTAADAATKASDAVKTQLRPLFSNAETQSPQFTFNTSNSQQGIDALNKRVASGLALNAWQGELASATSSLAQEETILNDSLSYLSTVHNFLTSVSAVLDGAVNLDSTTLGTYKTNVITGLNEVNTAIKNLNSISQSIASQKLTVSQSQAQYDLKKAGSSPQDIASAQAQVEQADAAVQSAEAKLQNARIISPLSGIVTQFDPKIGQLATPNLPLVTIMSEGGLEVGAKVSETDIGKIALGNPVTMNLDAFPGETFQGTVSYIAPAESLSQGVVTYEIKIAFARADARLKSGLTTNVVIQTKHKDNVLILPQYAIVQNDQGTFAQIVNGNSTKQVPITLGITDEKGNVEIVSGLSAGQMVQTVGLKQK